MPYILQEQTAGAETLQKKSRIWETLNLSTDAVSRTDTILEKLSDYFYLIFFLKKSHNLSLSLKNKIFTQLIQNYIDPTNRRG